MQIEGDDSGKILRRTANYSKCLVRGQRSILCCRGQVLTLEAAPLLSHAIDKADLEKISEPDLGG